MRLCISLIICATWALTGLVQAQPTARPAIAMPSDLGTLPQTVSDTGGPRISVRLPQIHHAPGYGHRPDGATAKHPKSKKITGQKKRHSGTKSARDRHTFGSYRYSGTIRYRTSRWGGRLSFRR